MEKERCEACKGKGYAVEDHGNNWAPSYVYFICAQCQGYGRAREAHEPPLACGKCRGQRFNDEGLGQYGCPCGERVALVNEGDVFVISLAETRPLVEGVPIGICGVTFPTLIMRFGRGPAIAGFDENERCASLRTGASIAGVMHVSADARKGMAFRHVRIVNDRGEPRVVWHGNWVVTAKPGV